MSFSFILIWGRLCRSTDTAQRILWAEFGRYRFHPPALNWIQIQCLFSSVSAWEVLSLPLISSNLDHFLRAKPRFFFFTRLQCVLLYVGWNTCLTQLHAHLCEEAFFSFLFCVIPCFRDAEKGNWFIYFSWSGYERGLFSLTSLPLLRKCVRCSAEDEVRHSADL